MLDDDEENFSAFADKMQKRTNFRFGGGQEDLDYAITIDGQDDK